jgi:hypothetical protein
VAFPSHLRSEAFGISLLEGAMYGKPMISSEIGTGTTYINIDGETGLVVPPSDPQAFGEAMRTLWDNPELAQAMGKRAEARYWELFTAEQMARSYTALYHELVARHASLHYWYPSTSAARHDWRSVLFKGVKCCRLIVFGLSCLYCFRRRSVRSRRR